MITATQLHKRAQERNGGPETLADIVARSRFAASWHLRRAESKRAQAVGFYAMAKDEGYTLVQREDALYAAANLTGESQIHEDASRFADSIADALIAVTG
jgi:hypothetical protein